MQRKYADPIFNLTVFVLIFDHVVYGAFMKHVFAVI